MRKILYMMFGCISLVLGIVGVVLPILPTVPFVLLAAFCFARSSERLDGWLKNTKLYKENNMKNGMTKQAKIRIMCSVTLLMSIGFIMMGLRGIVVGNLVLLIVWIFHIVYFTFGVKTV
ncbi:YbaN family protein [Holdemanella biformis]|uniref:YbaN family protein n=1 Tax=Holdemanella biformis TaxID=1735 RepID=UPI001C27797D|nr:YbaN family protein [Holdemanella biformis]MBU9895922.1 YbaN family protein [Holdemanella biformis]MBV3416993.1 YbaN family protein [Holdemanella biformis]